jgi:hypothetical protein
MWLGQSFVSIDGLTTAQAVAVELALRGAPAPWRYGLMLQLTAKLTGGDPFAGPPWRNGQSPRPSARSSTPTACRRRSCPPKR